MKLNPCIGGSESPVDSCPGFIAFILNRFDLSLKRYFISDPPFQTLPTKDAQFDLRHIQPAPVLWRVVKLQALEYAPCHFRSERFVKRRRLVSVQIVHHHTYTIGIRIPFLRQPLHLTREILARAPLGYLDVPGATLRLAHHEQVSRAVALVLIVNSLPAARPRLERLASFLNQLCAGFIETNRRPLPVIRLFVQIQHVFHMSHELSAYFRYAPLGFLPRLELRFFNNRRTCSCEYDSAKPSSTILSANNRNVQRARPSGALLQATAIKCASCF